MARYKMDGGKLVNTDKATLAYNEITRWDGRNHISIPTGSQWRHETLYLSNAGRWYIEYTSNYQGEIPRASWVSPEEAARWLLLCEDELPESLAPLIDTLEE